MSRVYRIPTKAWYRKHRLDETWNWQSIYGKHRCCVCRQHWKEKDVYFVNNNGDMQHIECQPPKRRKKA